MKASLIYLSGVVAIAAMAAAAVEGRAQGTQSQQQLTRFSVGVSAMLSDPRGDFGHNIGNGFGADGNFVYHIDRAGWLGLRFDGSGFSYGRERKQAPYSQTLGRVRADVTTTNFLGGISIGPELALPKGPIRPYVSAAFSGLFLRTTSSLKGSGSSDGSVASTTNFKDNTRAGVYGAGVRIPLRNSGIHPTLDLGIRYHRGGQASYLREGSIQDNPDGTISFVPLNSRTPYIGYVAGIRFRIPFDSRRSCPRWVC